LAQQLKEKNMAGQLDGKVAVVTGGGAGIGEAICRGFADEGCRVVVADREADWAAKVAQDIAGLAVTADVTSETEVKAIFQACDQAFGRLDVLVNNAGVVPSQVTAEDMDMAEWDQVIAINVRGVILCTKHGIPLLKRDGGAIVNMSSRVGYHGTPKQSHYAASKFAVRGITESVAHEVGPLGIRVNSLCPGTVETEKLHERVANRARTSGRTVEEIMETTFIKPAALGRTIAPDEICQAAIFLATDASSAITGTHLKIDAGRP
jgi:NAD(P)-dependent dehydrogenase (short-subunit alcohol dehydrogenase family)